MSNLLIIDVQNTYKSFFNEEFCSSIIDISSQYTKVIYLYDVLSGNSYYDELPESFIENEEFIDRLNVVTKEYGFFRSIMDINLDEEELVRLLKFMFKHNLGDNREIETNCEVLEEFKENFNKSPLLDIDFEDHPVSIPFDLIEELHGLSNVTIVGGGRNECVREIAILLQVLDIDYTVEESLTF